MSNSFLAYRTEGSIAHATLSRPDVLNAYDLGTYGEFAEVLERVGTDDDIRCLVVSAAGRAFSVGGSPEFLEALMDDPCALAATGADARKVIKLLLHLEKPVVTAINGVATGGALVFALLSDIIIMERRAKLAAAQLRLALPAGGDGGAMIWPLAAGITATKRYLLTGDWVPAEEALRIGLVSDVVDDGQGLIRAMGFAQRFASGPTAAIAATKRGLNQWMMHNLHYYEVASALLHPAFAAEAYREAVRELADTGVVAMPPEGSEPEAGGDAALSSQSER